MFFNAPSDLNECASDSLNRCDVISRADCTNTIGSYKCICRDGYTGDGEVCTGMEETIETSKKAKENQHFSFQHIECGSRCIAISPTLTEWEREKLVF